MQYIFSLLILILYDLSKNIHHPLKSRFIRLYVHIDQRSECTLLRFALLVMFQL